RKGPGAGCARRPDKRCESPRGTPSARVRGSGRVEELEVCASERRDHGFAGIQFSSIDLAPRGQAWVFPERTWEARDTVAASVTCGRPASTESRLSSARNLLNSQKASWNT